MRPGKSIEIFQKSFAHSDYDAEVRLGGANQLKVIHRISITPDESQRNTLLSLGLPLIESTSPLVRLVSFDIEEGEASWPKVKALIDQWNPADFVRTEFTDVERATASFLQMLGLQKGYPQPADDFGYLKATYDLSDYCATCGIGKKQVAPFRMKGEPKWGKKHFLQLNWVYDEYFVPPSIWEEVFHPFGLGRLPVLDHRTGDELRTVVQLEIKDTAKSELSLDGKYPSEICSSCNRTKVLPVSRGFFPAFAHDPSFPVCRTQEYFGSGASAWNAIIVNSAVYKAVQGHKLAGAMFAPLQAA